MGIPHGPVLILRKAQRLPNRPSSSRVRVSIPVVGLAAAILFASTGGIALGAEQDAVTWSAQPADELGPDGRAWVEQALDPGESAVEHLAVRNFSDREVTFRLTAADGFFNDNGRFNILPSDQQSTEAGTWIQVRDTVTVAAGQTAVVPYTITAPVNAQPGDHAAGVAASILSSTTGENGASVGVESRVGFRVMVRVTGELAPAATVEDLTISYRTSWNPFAPGDLVVEFDVRNSGNARLRLTGVVAAAERDRPFPPEDEPQELLVGDTRHFTVTVDDVWPTFIVPAAMTLDPDVVVVSGQAPEIAQIQASTHAIAIPWPQLVVVVGIALIVGAIMWRRGHSQRKLNALLDNAREEGRQAALESEGNR